MSTSGTRSRYLTKEVKEGLTLCARHLQPAIESEGLDHVVVGRDKKKLARIRSAFKWLDDHGIIIGES